MYISETLLSDDETKDEDVENDVVTSQEIDETILEIIKSYFLGGIKIEDLEDSDTLFLAEELLGAVLQEIEDSVTINKASDLLLEQGLSASCCKKDEIPVDDNNNICDFDATSAGIFMHSGYGNVLARNEKNTEEQSLPLECLGNIFSKECPGKQTPDTDDPNNGGPSKEKSGQGNANEENRANENSGKEVPGESNNPGNGGQGNGNSGDGNPGSGSSGNETRGDGDVQTRVEVTEDEQVLPDGTVVKRKILKRTFLKEIKVASTDDSGRFSPVVLEEIVGMEIEENIKEMAPGVSEPFDENVDLETKTESSEYQLTNGAPVKKTLTRIRAWLRKQLSTEQTEGHSEQVPLVSRTETESLSEGVLTGAPVCFDASVPEIQVTSVSEADSGLVNVVDEGAVRKDIPAEFQLKSGVTVTQTVLPGGTTVKTETITKVILKASAASQPSTTEPAKEDVDRIEIEELITEMAPGISEPFGSDVEAKMTCYGQSLQTPDGIPIQKNTIKIVACFKTDGLCQQSEHLEASSDAEAILPTDIPEKDLSTAALVDKCVSSENDKIIIVFASGTDGHPVTEGGSLSEGIQVRTEVSPNETMQSDIPHLTSASKEPGLGVGNVNIIDLNRRQGSGEVKTRTEESVDQKLLSDGTSVRTKIVTKTFFKERFSLTGKVEEEFVKTEIEEFVTKMAPGVSEPHGDDVETEVTQESSEYQLPNGSPVVKRLVKTVSRPKRRSVDRRSVSSDAQRSSADGLFGQRIERSAAAPGKTPSGNEDPQVRTEIMEDENVLADGTVVKKKTTTKTTVKEVQKDPGRQLGKLKPVPDEEIVQTEIEERIMQLAPGISDPFGDDVETESSTESFRYYLENGSPVVKTVVMVVARFPPRANSGSIASMGLAHSPKNSEWLHLTENNSRAGRMLEVSGDKKTSDTVVNGIFNGHYRPLTHPDVAKLTTSVSARKSVLCKKVRNVGPDGSITEEVCSIDEDGFSDSSSVSDIRDLSPFAFSSTTDDLFLDEYEPGSAAIQVCTRTEDEDPKIETDLKEYEDVLPDGTVVHRIMNKTIERKTFVNHVVIHTPHPGKHPSNDLTLDNYVEPYLAKYSHRCHGAPEVTTDTQDFEDVLPDGTVSKKRVTRKTEQQLSLERTLLIGNMPSLVGMVYLSGTIL